MGLPLGNFGSFVSEREAEHTGNPPGLAMGFCVWLGTLAVKSPDKVPHPGTRAPPRYILQYTQTMALHY